MVTDTIPRTFAAALVLAPASFLVPVMLPVACSRAHLQMSLALTPAHLHTSTVLWHLLDLAVSAGARVSLRPSRLRVFAFTHIFYYPTSHTPSRTRRHVCCC
ncbi:hypothetical protein EVG20_g10941 [Dentipellis fragilis]|uniref:Uncharacterized protein n=1 Tax=Dentipellis fragilis TaxID=205917 RepID=A0A4Y9XP91_9AGAM|nr:hypothetical protein EVG20_g10941 [Dentipellis fragilis]